MKKIGYFFIAMLAMFATFQNVNARVESTVPELDEEEIAANNEIVETIYSTSTIRITDVSPSGDQCIISLSSGETYKIEMPSGADSSNCGTDDYAIIRASSNTHYIIKVKNSPSKYETSGYDVETIRCGNVRGIPRGLPYLSRNIISIIKILVPVILIILGIIDMFRAATSSDEKAMKTAASKFVKRIIAAVLVFFVVVLIQFVVRTIANAANKANNGDIKQDADNIAACITCFISDEDYCTEDNYFEE